VGDGVPKETYRFDTRKQPALFLFGRLPIDMVWRRPLFSHQAHAEVDARRFQTEMAAYKEVRNVTVTSVRKHTCLVTDDGEYTSVWPSGL
jgi:hypothetical protein